jgi:hypothetical protein
VGYDLPELQVIRRSGAPAARDHDAAHDFRKIWKEEKILGDSCHSARSRSRDRERGTLHGCRRRPRANRPDAQRDHGLTTPCSKRWPGSLAAGWDGETPRTRCTIWPPPKILSARLRRSGAAAAFNNLVQVLAERGKLYEALPATDARVSLGGPLLVITQATPAEIRKASPEK